MRTPYAGLVPAVIVGSLAACVLAAPAQAASAPAARTAAARPATYRVAVGDTVFGIAMRFRLRTADVLAWNGLGREGLIHPGQVLSLAAPTPTARPRTTARQPAPRRAAATTYTVRAGDTVVGIARRLGTTTDAMLSANGLSWSSMIFPGQRLTIPGDHARVEPGGRPAALAAADTTTSPAAYTVQAGDTVSGIASRHGVGVAALLSANGLGWTSIIYPGQRLRIPGDLPGLNGEQSANARLIVRVGRGLGVPERGLAIALGAAMQESGLRNLAGGDRDSLGLFQQRPSMGWGTPAQIRDPARATRAFFGGPDNPNGSRTRGLLDVAGWQRMSFTQAAQAVQRSEFPTLYAQWEKPADAWLAAIGR